ncbi:hypothetical protein PR048_026552 [Dryococelus australis]|uniref:Reverse transcriptase n=1 Tax=Dryococelus australis TaxID=614101 RepID=A0ABQ9GLN2_9NEOP|nr:hypothetical protein PR048_026552 [Dryococelus australis]
MKLDIRKLENMAYFLSMNVEYCNGEMSIHQTDYIKQILREFKLEDGKGKSALWKLMTMETRLGMRNMIHNCTGRQWVHYCTYPQLPGQIYHMQFVELARCKTHYVVPEENSKPELTLVSTGDHVDLFCDADYANGKDRKSVSDCVVTLANVPVSWKTRVPKKKDPVATSTTEAEYASMFHAAKEALWLNCDTELSKHFDIKYQFFRDYVEKGIMKFDYVPSNKNLAYLFTKAMNRPKTQCFVKAIHLF